MVYRVFARHEYTAGEYILELTIGLSNEETSPIVSLPVDIETWRRFGVGDEIFISLEAA